MKRKRGSTVATNGDSGRGVGGDLNQNSYALILSGRANHEPSLVFLQNQCQLVKVMVHDGVLIVTHEGE